MIRAPVRTFVRGIAKPHIYCKRGVWYCTTNHGPMVRAGHGFTPGTAYDYWRTFPRHFAKRDVLHGRRLTARSY